MKLLTNFLKSAFNWPGKRRQVVTPDIVKETRWFKSPYVGVVNLSVRKQMSYRACKWINIKFKSIAQKNVSTWYVLRVAMQSFKINLPRCQYRMFHQYSPQVGEQKEWHYRVRRQCLKLWGKAQQNRYSWFCRGILHGSLKSKEFPFLIQFLLPKSVSIGIPGDNRMIQLLCERRQEQSRPIQHLKCVKFHYLLFHTKYLEKKLT